MPTVLVDTAAWIALVNTRDELHDRAKEIMGELRRSNVALVTTDCDRLDKEWSLTDCVSLAVMEKEQIKEAFTSDHHFEQAGFVKLL